MAHEILSVKLCQLDDELGMLHSRIRLGENAGHEQLSREISQLSQECSQLQSENDALKKKCEERDALVRENTERSDVAWD